MIARAGPGRLYVWVPGRGWTEIGQTGAVPVWRAGAGGECQRGADSETGGEPGGGDDG